jgi:4-amino-4-deoxy-L-arabinose transferase-like glycosyltransferase
VVFLRRESESEGELPIPAWIWLILGYTFFSWGTLRLISLSETRPDMLVAAFFFVACGLLVKMQRRRAGWPTYLILGLVLGASYLTKPIMFPVSLACLVGAFGCGVRFHRLRRACGALLVFLLVSLPFIAALSNVKHKLTYGESGTYNYATYVDHIDAVHWQGEIPGAGKPIHPTRQIFDHPATYEFGSPMDVTYPVWYDQSYWSLGLKSHFDLRSQLKVFAAISESEFATFFSLQGSMVAGLFVLLFVSGRKWSILKDSAKYWFLLLPAIGALALYSLVHFEPRYSAPFSILTILCLFFSVHLPRSEDNRRVFSAVAVLIVVMFVDPLGAPSIHIKSAVRDLVGRPERDPNSYQEVARDLQSLGLRPGDRIASMESSDYNAAVWAYLSQVRIVAEVHYFPHDLFDLSANNFWAVNSATQANVLQSLSRTGAIAAISQFAPPTAVASGWKRVGNSQYYLYWLQPLAQSGR